MQRRRSLIGPLVLITIGILALLANLGYLSSSFWLIAARFWPLILILIGLDILIGRRSSWGALLVLLIGLLLIGIVILFSVNPGLSNLSSTATTDQIAQPLDEALSAIVELSPGWSEATIKNLDGASPNLVQGTVTHPTSVRLDQTRDTIGAAAHVRIGEAGGYGFIPGRGGEWDLGLTNRIPLRLNVNAGVGKSTLDLNALNVTRLDLNAGVGEIVVILPSHAGAVTASVDGGVGSITAFIPQGVAGRIRVNTGLGGVRINESRFPRIGDNLYESADYANAPNKIDLDVNGGIGSINVP